MDKINPMCIMLPKMNGYVKYLYELIMCPFSLKMKICLKHIIRYVVRSTTKIKKGNFIENQCLMRNI